LLWSIKLNSKVWYMVLKSFLFNIVAKHLLMYCLLQWLDDYLSARVYPFLKLCILIVVYVAFYFHEYKMRVNYNYTKENPILKFTIIVYIKVALYLPLLIIEDFSFTALSSMPKPVLFYFQRVYKISLSWDPLHI
jgi:hypothetical protein